MAYFFFVLFSLFAEFAGIPIEDQASVREIRERNYFIIGLLLVLPGFYFTFNKNSSVQTGVLIRQNYLINNDNTLSIEERDFSYNQFERETNKKFLILNIIPWIVVQISIVFLIKSKIVVSIFVIFITCITLITVFKNDIFHIFRPEESFRSPDSIKINFFHSVDQHMSEKDRMGGS